MKRIFRFFTGLVIAVVIFPFYLAGWLIYGIAIVCRDFWCFAGNFIESMEPDYIPPIGLGGFYCLCRYRKAAMNAVAENNYDKAVEYWKKCANYYDSESMYQLARYYETQNDEGRNSSALALEWYALSASFQNWHADVKYQELTGSLLDKEEKRKIRKNFLYNRNKKMLKSI